MVGDENNSDVPPEDDSDDDNQPNQSDEDMRDAANSDGDTSSDGTGSQNSSDGLSGLEEESDDDDGDDDGEARTQALMLAEAQAEGNPNDIENHVRLLQVLRKQQELAKLRQARETMASLFPLTEELWHDWLDDEERVANVQDEAQREELLGLFKRALRDFLSVSLHVRFCKFLTRCNSGKPSDTIRTAYEECISACKFHFASSHLAWNGFREFETSLQTSDSVQRIQKLYLDQLSIPSQQLVEVKAQYFDWAKTANITDVSFPESEFNSAVAKFEKISTFERDVQATRQRHGRNKANTLAAWKVYLSKVEQQGTATTESTTTNRSEANGENNLWNVDEIVCLFERFVADCNTFDEVWLKYINFLRKHNKPATVISSVLARAVHSCYWSGPLWLLHLRFAEVCNKPFSELSENYERALASGISPPNEIVRVFLAFADCTRRQLSFCEDDESRIAIAQQLRQILQRATQFVQQTNTENGSGIVDVHSTVERYWANIEMHVLGDVETARSLWDSVLEQHPSNQFLWKERIDMEFARGDTAACRELFQKALGCLNNVGSVHALASDWVRFEGLFGTFETYCVAGDATQAKIDSLASSASTERTNNRREHEKRPFDDKKRPFDNNRKFSGEGGKPRHPREEQRRDTRKPQQRQQRTTNERGPDRGRDRAAQGKRKQPEPNQGDREPQAKRQRLQFAAGSQKPSDTTANTKATKQTNTTQQASTTEEAPQKPTTEQNQPPAQPTDGTKSQPSAKKTSAPAPAAPAQMEPNTVFISNLRKTCTEAEVQVAFSGCGQVNAVRLIRTKGGILRGYGYVEFATEEEAARAVAENGKLLVQGRGIKVKPSVQVPPQEVLKGNAAKTANQVINSTLGTKQPIPSARATPKPSVTTIPVTALMPRGVARKAATKIQTKPPQQQQQKNQTEGGAVNESSKEGGEQQQQQQGDEAAPKSNADFRKLFGL